MVIIITDDQESSQITTRNTFLWWLIIPVENNGDVFLYNYFCSNTVIERKLQSELCNLCSN